MADTTPKEPRRHNFKATTGTSRATSDYIRLHPGESHGEVVQALANSGHNRMTVYALITQMKRQGLVSDTNGRLTANYTEYTPVKSYASWKNAVAKGKVPAPSKPKKVRETAPAPEPVAATEPRAVRLTRLQSATEVLANLSVVEAHKLYVELDKMFGGR